MIFYDRYKINDSVPIIFDENDKKDKFSKNIDYLKNENNIKDNNVLNQNENISLFMANDRLNDNSNNL